MVYENIISVSGIDGSGRRASWSGLAIMLSFKAGGAGKKL